MGICLFLQIKRYRKWGKVEVIYEEKVGRLKIRDTCANRDRASGRKKVEKAGKAFFLHWN